MKYLFKSMYRNFVRKPVTNLVNLTGLSVSLALVIILSVYCYSELTTDHFHKNGDRVYLFLGNDKNIYTPAILKEHIDRSVPGVESTVRMAGTWDTPVFQAGDKEPITSDLLFADEDFFKLFTYKVVEGDLGAALKEPLSVVITKTLSERLFGKEGATGKTMKLNNGKDLTVKAVVEEPGANSCISFSALASIATRKIVMPNGEELTSWNMGNFQTFVLLKQGARPEETTKSIAGLFPKNVSAPKRFEKAQLIPLKKIYFSQFSLFFGKDYLHSGDRKKVMILLMVAALVLMIALINFINISSSQWLEKIRQTGVMKVIGASRWVVLRHVLSESSLLFFMSLFLAILLVCTTTSLINTFTGIRFNLRLLYSPAFLLASISGIIILSVLISLIPALQISSSRAVDNLKKTIEGHTKNSVLRGTLVAVQFTIAIVLIAFTVLVQKQVDFGSSNLGFSQENIIGIKLTPELNKKREVLKKILSETPSVEKISFCQYYPGQIVSHWQLQVDVLGEKKQLDFDTFTADTGFFNVMGLKLIAGRFYSGESQSDKGKFVVNETFLRNNKLTNPIGLKFTSMNGHTSEIIGVVKDFHYKSFNKPIGSLAIRNDPYAQYCLVSLHTPDFAALNKTFQVIKAENSRLSPSFPVEVSFLNQAVEKMYQSELQFRRTFSLFAGCAIVISCLGILAMSLFACQRRIKEIGIRKVNGAKVSEILLMLNKDFVRWVVVAFIIATPIAWYVMHKWLENFAYKTNLSWWIFASAGVLVFIIALSTASWQSWKAATRNPVEALRYE